MPASLLATHCCRRNINEPLRDFQDSEIWILFRYLSHLQSYSLNELIAKRELVAIRIGRARRIPESALDGWIAQHISDEGDSPCHDTHPGTRPSAGNGTGRLR
jgi:hypothetical protein